MESVTSFFWNEGSKNGGSSAIQEKRGPTSADNGSSSGSGTAVPGSGMQKMMTDTLIEKIMRMALPPTTEMAMDNLETRIAAAKGRPSLSVQIMSRNFVLMNSRLSLPFTLIDEVNKIFEWSNPAYTVSVVLIYSYIILRPLPTITSIPIFYLLFGVMVPQFLYIHKPNGSPYLEVNPMPADGPPLRKAEVPKPVPELSQEFILNLTDLQNRLMLYVKTYDFIDQILVKFAFFTDEKKSSVAFVLLLSVALVNALFMDFFLTFIPLKAILLALGWSFAIMMHPHNREKFFSTVYSEETRLRLLALSDRYDKLVGEQLRYIEAREHRMVAVYEIQKFKHGKGWAPVGYSNDDFTLFSTLRIREEKIEDHCTSLLEEVKPPVDWQWLDDINWALDLNPTEWLEEGLVEYVDTDLGTKWVYDLNLDGSRGGYRRRMWTNICIRKIECEPDDNDDNDDEDDDDLVSTQLTTPTKVEKYSSHRVTRGSMSGVALPEDDTRPTVKRDSSTLSLSSAVSSNSSTHSNHSEPSKAIDNLRDVLNSST